MHAALMHLTINPALAPAAAAAFTRVRAAPGFVAGYWLDPVDRQGFGFLRRRSKLSEQHR